MQPHPQWQSHAKAAHPQRKRASRGPGPGRSGRFVLPARDHEPLGRDGIAHRFEQALGPSPGAAPSPREPALHGARSALTSAKSARTSLRRLRISARLSVRSSCTSTRVSARSVSISVRNPCTSARVSARRRSISACCYPGRTPSTRAPRADMGAGLAANTHFRLGRSVTVSRRR